ncbi:putative epoxide hydrolase [Cyphellophora attinorum]|uniref:Putative epoxide hydrolase n=1 Tax=Cyphellophora attinorum TaxID=1664694 RepID=A0A0N1H4Q0_9EURO|nr:putative epoxide hydrolase [Phialophora attinorum]KPI37095.1 putative epoxide hydrolase [Phialophora attinorum]
MVLSLDINTRATSPQCAINYVLRWDHRGSPHFTTEIEGLTIHFIHQKSNKADAIPLLMCHGWPGSFYEFSQVINPLSSGADGKSSFHCVVPSLPGFGWSSGPPKGWTLQQTARVFHTLMQRLGYKDFVFQGGDWAHWIGRELGANYSDSCKVVHFNFAPAPLPEGVELTDREKEVAGRVDDWLENHMGYAIMMRTRPHTIGWMCQDNPVAIMVWLGEKYNEAAAPQNQDSDSWRTHILTTASIYYFSNCVMTSSLPYYENVRHENFSEFAMKPQNRIKAPFGYTSFYWDTEPSSKRAVERTGNLVFYRERNDGGHFACLESHDGVCEDRREIVGKYWKP